MAPLNFPVPLCLVPLVFAMSCFASPNGGSTESTTLTGATAAVSSSGPSSASTDAQSSSESDPSDSTSANTSTPTSSSGQPGDVCSSSKDCGLEEVCYQGQCADAWQGFTYEVRLLVFEPVCPEDQTCFTYTVEFDGSLLDPSGQCRMDCPVSWPGISAVDIVPTVYKEPFQLSVLWVGDLNVWIDAVCWDKSTPQKLIEDCYPSLDDICDCGPVPKMVLHDGHWQGSAHDALIDLEFRLKE